MRRGLVGGIRLRNWRNPQDTAGDRHQQRYRPSELNRVQFVPLTTNIGRLHPSEAYVQIGGGQRKAMADQLTTISKLRQRIGSLDRGDVAAVERAICLQLGL